MYLPEKVDGTRGLCTTNIYFAPSHDPLDDPRP